MPGVPPGRGYRPSEGAREGAKAGSAAGAASVHDEVRAAVELRLKKGWTPELISARARLEGRATVCPATSAPAGSRCCKSCWLSGFQYASLRSSNRSSLTLGT